MKSYPAKTVNSVRIIFLGDVVGRPGRAVLKQHLAQFRKDVSADLVIINGENAAGGAGIDAGTAREIQQAGADVITLGDHAFQRKGSSELLHNNSAWCIRPLNLPSDKTPGKGECVVTLGDGTRVAVVNLLGRVFLSGVMECPFRALSGWLERHSGHGYILVCDLHAEATSEKLAMARYADGKLSLLVGTHTHVQTSDAQILPGGTGYITDLGMTGCDAGVIGMKTDVALQRFLGPSPAPYEIAEGQGVMKGIIADIDRSSRQTLAIYAV